MDSQARRILRLSFFTRITLYLAAGGTFKSVRTVKPTAQALVIASILSLFVMGTAGSASARDTTPPNVPSGFAVTLKSEAGPEPAPPVGSISACIEANEGFFANLSCPGDKTITSIDFAGYGQPTGSCGEGYSLASCHATDSRSIVEASCLNQSECAISAGKHIFGDPCPDKPKRIAIAYTCGGGGSDACPDDPDKTEPGRCGCGEADIDIDNDGIFDCKPTCSDGIQNQDETGVDCGGSCPACTPGDYCTTNPGRASDSGLKQWCWHDMTMPGTFYSNHNTDTGYDLVADVECNEEQLWFDDNSIHFRLEATNPAPDNWCRNGFNMRSEVRTMPWPVQNPIGTEEWFGWRYTFPDDYVIDRNNQWAMFQIHPSEVAGVGGLSPQIDINVVNENQYSASRAGEIYISVSPQDSSTRNQRTHITPLAGDSLDIVVYVKWGLAGSGILKVWINNVLVRNDSGLANVYEHSPWGGNAKWGIYKHPWRNETDVKESIAQGVPYLELIMGPLRQITRFPDDLEYGRNEYDTVKPQGPVNYTSTGSLYESCYDGIQNQDETGVDCGGSICAACPTQFWNFPPADHIVEQVWEELPNQMFTDIEYFKGNQDPPFTWQSHTPGPFLELTDEGLELSWDPNADKSAFPGWLQYRSELAEPFTNSVVVGTTSVFATGFVVNNLPAPLTGPVTIFQRFRDDLDRPDLDVELARIGQFPDAEPNSVLVHANGDTWKRPNVFLKGPGQTNDLVVVIENKQRGKYKVSLNGQTIAQGTGDFAPATPTTFTAPKFGIYNHGGNQEYFKFTHKKYGRYTYNQTPNFNQINSIKR